MILQGDCREVLTTLPSESAQCCVTSPPYWGLRDYGVDGQLGMEATPEQYVAAMVDVFRAVRRVLRPDGTLWLNLGDSYTTGGSTARRARPTRRPWATYMAGCGASGRRRGLKAKDLVGIPWRVAFALQADGWWLRSDIIWSKPNPMPESVTDRPTKAHEYVFLLTKSERYYYDADAIREPHEAPRKAGRFTGNAIVNAMREGRDVGDNLGERKLVEPHPLGRNARSVWSIATQPFPEAHFAVFPPELARRCVLAGSRPGDTVLDPFNGAGTAGLVAQEHGRAYVGIELNPEYIAIAERRLSQQTLWMDGAA